MGFNFKKKFRGTRTFRSENPIIPEVRFFEPQTSPDQVTGTKKNPPQKNHMENKGAAFAKKKWTKWNGPWTQIAYNSKLLLTWPMPAKPKLQRTRRSPSPNEHSMLKNEMTRKLKTWHLPSSLTWFMPLKPKSPNVWNYFPNAAVNPNRRTFEIAPSLDMVDMKASCKIWCSTCTFKGYV